ncbi:MAG: GGDEF domain-containing protein [Leptolyngbyaceae cyanobacterium MAG.088]|nr:GGDEF domain-containing protein [Leptolyngbyaceae cyanobacterium MAG.088]
MFSNKRIEDYYQLCEKTLNFSKLSWWIIDLEDDPNVFYCNREMCETFSLDPNIIQHAVSETCPIPGNHNNHIGVSDSVRAKQAFDEYEQLKRGVIDEYHNCFCYYNSVIGETLSFSSRVRPLLKDGSGNVQLLVGIIEPELSSAELYEKATVDKLTGLKNHREFDAQLSFLMNLAIRENHHISLIMWDIDGFKQYNQLLGHAAGDQCLIQIAQSVSDLCRRSSDIVCRYGKEKFAVITYGDAKDAFFLAETLRARIFSMAIPHPGKDNTPVTLSVGYCSILPDEESTPEKLIEYAEAALYQAKIDERNDDVQFKESVGMI